MNDKTKIVAIACHKGGVGKTTTAASIGSLLSSSGFRTLLVDLDAQKNLTSTFLSPKFETDKTLYEAFRGLCDLPVVNVRENLDIVPSSLDMGAIDTEIASKIQRESILKRLLLPVQDQYDWILLDGPSQLAIATVNAFAAATSVIVPLSCDAYAAEGLLQLSQMVDVVSSGLNPGLKIDGILVTRYHTRRSLDRLVEEDLRKRYGGLVFKTRIRENAAVVQAPVMCLDIASFAPKSNGALDYKNLLDELTLKMHRSFRYE